MSIERKPVVSSNIVSVGYDSATRTLHVEFKSLGVYEYDSVPPETYAALMAAKSAGGYLAANIKGRFSYRRLPVREKQGEPG